jgi:transcriptional regulator with XRE-family HTH domain
MPARTTLDQDGRRLADRIRHEVGKELRSARRASGLSQHAAAIAVGMSHAQFGRIERGELEDLTVAQACRAGLAVGLRLGSKYYPDGDPVRDRAQLALLERFRQRLPADAGWWTEVPLPIPGDRRAWDGLLRLDGRRAGCEAETRITDVQALERRLALKLRDGEVDVLILLVSDTSWNRRVLAAHREGLRTLLPFDGREVLRALASGYVPNESGLLVL